MHLPFADQLRLACRSVQLWFGLAFVAGGALVVVDSGWRVIYFYTGPVAVAPGRIVTAYPTTCTVNETPVKGLTFRYQVAGLEWAGNSFSTDSTLRPGTARLVEYCVGQPACARLQGTDVGPFGTTGLLGGTAFIVVGLVSAMQGARRTRQLLALVADAVLTEATCQRLEPKKPRGEDDAAYVAHYAYQAGGQPLVYLFETSDTSRFGIKEPLVYQFAAPANAVLLATLPGFIRRRLAPACEASLVHEAS